MIIKNQIIFIGGGNMAQAIITGLISCNVDKSNIFVADTDQDKRAEVETKFSIKTTKKILTLSENAIVILATKPDQIHKVCEEISSQLNNQIIISIAAGVQLSQIQKYLKGYDQIIRTMPNLVAQIQKSITAAYAHPNINDRNKLIVDYILNTFGDCIWLEDEKKLDAVTAISGSGPAYVFYFLQIIIQAGEEIGLSSSESQKLALKMLQGSAQFAERNISDLETIILNVTSKGGTTEQALKYFKNHSFNKIIKGAINAAYTRAKEIGEK